MSNDDYVVGRAYGEMAPNQSSIYEALLEKAERELDKMQNQRDLAMQVAEMIAAERDEVLETLSEWDDAVKHVEAERERDHYKEALEEISTTIQEYKDSMIQEPAEDFIWAIKAWADKKLNEL